MGGSARRSGASKQYRAGEWARMGQVGYTGAEDEGGVGRDGGR